MVSRTGSGKLESAGAADVVERTRRLEGAGMRSFVEDPPFVLSAARGALMVDADGREYVDLYATFAVAAVGHQHPAVVEAVRRQADVLMHCSSAHPSPVRAEFYEALIAIAPSGLTRVLPAITGAMANEIAIAIARIRRPGAPVITFEGSYFGRSVGAVGYAGKPAYRERLGLPASAQFVPYPDSTVVRDASGTLEAIERLVGRAGGVGPPAAIILEAVQGNGGVVIPTADLLPGLRAICDRTGALLIVDEIQAGCGRTGRMWAFERSGVVADLVSVGKGLGGGLAVGAVLGTDEAMSVLEPDAYSSTFLTNNLNQAAAVAAIGVLRDEGLPARADQLGRDVLTPRVEAMSTLRGVGSVRTIGLWAGIPIRDDDDRPDAARTGRIVRAARAAGVVVGRGGYFDEVLKISPPLVIDEGDLARALDRVAEAIGGTR